MKTLLQLIIGIAICLALAVLLRINPTEQYGALMGVVHGFLFVPNWLISLFHGSWLVKAPLHTAPYNAAWWVCTVINVAYWLWAITGAVIAMVKGR